MQFRSLLVAAFCVLTLWLCACSYTVNSTLNPDKYFLALRLAERRNYDTARSLWEPLAKDGDCDAQYQLGFLYFVAYGVDLNVPKALEFWTTAANRGQPRAQIALGDVYFMNPNGRFYCRVGCEGVPADPTAAYRWYLLAERAAWYKQDKEYLAIAIPRVRDALTPEQRGEAERQFNQWKPTPDECRPRRAL